MTTKPEVAIRSATTTDQESVRHFLRKFFFRDEPLNQSLSLISDEYPVNDDLEKFTFQGFGKGLDLIAEYEGKLVGVCLNGITEKGASQEPFNCVPGNKFEKIVRLLEHVESTVDVFSRYPDIKRYLSVFILSVDTSFRGKGIAKKLVDRTKELAKEKNAGLIMVECTSFFSAAVCKSLGFKQIYALNYADYKKNGEIVFKPASPHNAVTVYVSKL